MFWIEPGLEPKWIRPKQIYIYKRKERKDNPHPGKQGCKTFLREGEVLPYKVRAKSPNRSLVRVDRQNLPNSILSSFRLRGIANVCLTTNRKSV